ncbi:MAG: aconitate hydratase, partial [Desulfovibrionaceae bacterium]|nr:aconitate hydratase [Desulfovibrionaceae bacterium]
AVYDEEIEIDLSKIAPMAARPHMPDQGVPVAELDGLRVDQVAIGSCTNSSYADLEIVSRILKNRLVSPSTDVMISPGSKRVLVMLAEDQSLRALSDSGARLLECSCGPCIGMGGSPVSGGVSVRTFNRNFEGRSGTKDAQVYLVSPETAAQAALNGKFTNPDTWGTPPDRKEFAEMVPDIHNLFIMPPEDGSGVEVLRGPNIVPIKPFDRLPVRLEAEVAIRLGDNITTDHILPAGPEITSLRSNIPAISRYIFGRVDEGFVGRAENAGQSVIVAGENYGQGSSREHAALAHRHLGVRAIIARSLARIHRDNLVNFGILPLTFVNPGDYDKLGQGVRIVLDTSSLTPGGESRIRVGEQEIPVRNNLTSKELEVIRAGGMLNYIGGQQ